MEIEWFGCFKVLKEVVYFFVIDLEERTIDVVALSLIGFIVLDFLEETVNGSWNKTGIVLIGNEILKESILMFLGFCMFLYCTLPVTAEHSVSFS